MKVLAINGSPNGSKGNTEILLDAFLKERINKRYNTNRYVYKLC